MKQHSHLVCIMKMYMFSKLMPPTNQQHCTLRTSLFLVLVSFSTHIITYTQGWCGIAEKVFQRCDTVVEVIFQQLQGVVRK